MTETIKDISAFIIHVRGNDVRKEYVKRQMEAQGISYEFILDGNKEDLTNDILDRYFCDGGEVPMHGQYPQTSCVYKHLLACQEIISRNLDGALILEDDIRLYGNFSEMFMRSMEEYNKLHSDEPFLANYEESSLLFIPRSQRRKGQLLYKATRDRFAGCYYLNRKAAEAIMAYVSENKSCFTSDRLHNHLIGLGMINYYWSHPCIACQCSCDGSMPTMIPTRPRPWKRLKWFYKRAYKHILYWFR